MRIIVLGKPYPLRVTLGAQLMFKQDRQKEISEMEGVEDFSHYLFCCAKSASLADGIEFSVTEEQFYNAFDQELLDLWEDMQRDYVEKKTKRMIERTAKIREADLIHPA